MASLISRKYSVLCFEYTSGSKVFEATFALGCLTPNHIQVYVEDDLDGLGEQNYLDFTYDSVTETVEVTSDITIPDGSDSVTVVVQRTVPKEQLYISFGGGADVTRTNIDGMIKYTLMALHEVLDGRWDISFDWEQLNEAYRSLYLLLAGGSTNQVLAKVSDTDYDIAWATISQFPTLDNHANAGTTATADPAWNGKMVMLPHLCTTVSFPVDADWDVNDEFILQGDQAWQINLVGTTLYGTSNTNTSIAVQPYPSGVVCRYMGSNQWLFIGNAELM